MIEPLLATTRDHMKKAVEVTSNDLSSIRSGRATPALVEHLVIAVYGGTQHLKLVELATTTTMDAKTIVISPYDPSVIQEIARGIEAANTGLTPVVDGEVIRITIPPLSEERRQEYIKLARVKLEAGKVMVRQVRQGAMKDLQKLEADSELSEDEVKHAQRLIQELTDEVIADVDAIGERKEAELLQV